MDLAAAVLAAGRTAVRRPTSARVGRHPPQFSRLDSSALPTRRGWRGSSLDEWQATGDGTLVVIAPRAGPRRRRRDSPEPALPDGIVSADSDTLGAPVSVLTVAGAKGLEFDTVVLVEPSAIVAESAPRPQRPVRRADPGDAAPARRPPGRPARGDVAGRTDADSRTPPRHRPGLAAPAGPAPAGPRAAGRRRRGTAPTRAPVRRGPRAPGHRSCGRPGGRRRGTTRRRRPGPPGSGAAWRA